MALDVAHFVAFNRRDPGENTNLRGSITVHLTSYLFCLDSVANLKLNWHQLYLFV